MHELLRHLDCGLFCQNRRPSAPLLGSSSAGAYAPYPPVRDTFLTSSRAQKGYLQPEHPHGTCRTRGPGRGARCAGGITCVLNRYKMYINRMRIPMFIASRRTHGDRCTHSKMRTEGSPPPCDAHERHRQLQCATTRRAHTGHSYMQPKSSSSTSGRRQRPGDELSQVVSPPPCFTPFYAHWFTSFSFSDTVYHFYCTLRP